MHSSDIVTPSWCWASLTESLPSKLWGNIGLMLGQRRSRWASTKPKLFQCIVLIVDDDLMLGNVTDDRQYSG